MYKFIIIILTIWLINSTCTRLNVSNSISLGQTYALCLIIRINNVNSTYAFPVKADQFSALSITNLSSMIDANVSKVQAIIEFQNYLTDNQSISMVVFQKQTNKTIYRNIFSIVLQVMDGVFNTTVNDNADCSACTGANQTCANASETQSSVIVQNQACFEVSSNNSYGGNSTLFFLSWIGTDINGNHFLSHTQRLSRFTQYSVGSIYNQAKSLFS